LEKLCELSQLIGGFEKIAPASAISPDLAVVAARVFFNSIPRGLSTDARSYGLAALAAQPRQLRDVDSNPASLVWSTRHSEPLALE
jgi:hypothetical protein